MSQEVTVSISWDVRELQSSVQGGLCETLLPVDTQQNQTRHFLLTHITMEIFVRVTVTVSYRAA